MDLENIVTHVTMFSKSMCVPVKLSSEQDQAGISQDKCDSLYGSMDLENIVTHVTLHM